MGPYVPACSLDPARDPSDLQSILLHHQEAGGALVILLLSNMTFSSKDWPEDGVNIVSNVTILAMHNHRIVVDFALQPQLFNVGMGDQVLKFYGCVLINLPLVYLPMDHPRRHFGILSTGLWPVYRESFTLMVDSCTLVLSADEFAFWQYWFSLMVSPVSTVQKMVDWTFANMSTVKVSGVCMCVLPMLGACVCSLRLVTPFAMATCLAQRSLPNMPLCRLTHLGKHTSALATTRAGAC